jgi:hypothetical protein
MALKWREKRGLNNAGNIMESGEYYGIKMLGNLHNFIVLIPAWVRVLKAYLCLQPESQTAHMRPGCVRSVGPRYAREGHF